MSEQLRGLREDSAQLKRQLQEQAAELESSNVEESALRDRVQEMVFQLEGPSQATEERPYEKMRASMFAEGGMFLSK